MNNRKQTKRALLTSIMALVMCVVMLLGTTFAWFTDTASTNVNKIQAGNLDVLLEMQEADGTWDRAEGNSRRLATRTRNSCGSRVVLMSCLRCVSATTAI